MPTIATTEAFIVDGVQTTALEQRLYDTAMFLGDGTANGVRGGVVRHGDTSLAVSVNGSDQVTIQAGACVIPGSTGQGVWRGALAAATSAVGITARNSTNPRIDLVVAQATGTNIAFKTIDGTPGVPPSAPALPAQHIELARLTVPAVGGGAVTVDSSWRAYATALGGTLLVETAARLPGSGSQKWQRAVALDTGTVYTWDGTAWSTGAAWPAYTPTWITGNVLGNGTLAGAYEEVGKTVRFRVQLTVGSTTSVSTNPQHFTLPVAVKTGTFPVFHGEAYDTSVGGAVQLRTNMASATEMLLLVPPTSAGGYDRPLTNTVPFAWGAGDRIFVSGTYERA